MLSLCSLDMSPGSQPVSLSPLYLCINLHNETTTNKHQTDISKRSSLFKRLAAETTSRKYVTAAKQTCSISDHCFFCMCLLEARRYSIWNPPSRKLQGFANYTVAWKTKKWSHLFWNIHKIPSIKQQKTRTLPYRIRSSWLGIEITKLKRTQTLSITLPLRLWNSHEPG